jgi:hypothetical protein
MNRYLALAFLGTLALPTAAAAEGPLDLFPPETMAKIQDRSTLNQSVVQHHGWSDVYFDSETGDAKWADEEDPYKVDSGTIRIHGYLASPRFGGPHPAVVVGHGHGSQGSKQVALALAALGYVALSIDGPGAGQSTGGPQDTPQAWISVEEEWNVPSPTVSYLYHYAYAGMRALTLLDHLSRLPYNPFRIDRSRFGVIGASMGGQLVYYVNGVDPRVKGAVAIAVAGDWRNLVFYEGSWLYHALYYDTRDGIESGNDNYPNTITSVCPGVRDPTAETFLTNFDPIAYAPTQHAPLLTIIGTHDQPFTVPAVNTTYDRVASAGTDPRFIKRIMLAPNGKHQVIDGDRLLQSVLPVLADVHAWFDYCFRRGDSPPETPEVRMSFEGDRMRFQVFAPEGDASVRRVRLYWATQLDALPPSPCDFGQVELRQRESDHHSWRRGGSRHWSRWRSGSGSHGGEWEGFLPLGARPACGPEATPENVLYYASVSDGAGYTVSSKLYYGFEEMSFESAVAGGFSPVLDHFPGDDLPVPAPPSCEAK